MPTVVILKFSIQEHIHIHIIFQIIFMTLDNVMNNLHISVQKIFTFNLVLIDFPLIILSCLVDISIK